MRLPTSLAHSSLTHSLTHSLAHSLTHSLTRALSLTPPLTPQVRAEAERLEQVLGRQPLEKPAADTHTKKKQTHDWGMYINAKYINARKNH